MGTLTFSTEGLKRIVDHVRNSKEFMKGWDKKQKTNCVCLVHDDGVYLMSAGLPRDLVMKKSPNGQKDVESSFCIHAKGTNPATDEDWWDEARSLVGGDDFVEYLPVEHFEDVLAGGGPSFNIVMTEETIDIQFTKPKPASPPPVDKPKRGKKKAA